MNRKTFSMAFAIFSMFFGAGNAIFPLILGMKAGGSQGVAFMGLLITAIGGPLLGLVGGTLYSGRCVDFFCSAGKWPGRALIGVTLALLGPLAVLPRCVSVAYAATSAIVPMPLYVFAGIFCVVALLCAWEKRSVLVVLGYVLSPLLILCLLGIIYKGFVFQQSVESVMTHLEAFKLGVLTGYDTMDLIASIYFSAGIWALLSIEYKDEPRMVVKTTLKAGIMGCMMLAFIYYGLSMAAAKFSPQLMEVAPEALMTQLALLVLSPAVASIANMAIALACLTTVISLGLTLSHIICEELMPKLNYTLVLIGMMGITMLMANLGFNAIMHIIHPVVSVCYPVIILLTLYNITRKLNVYRNDFKNREYAKKAP